MGTNCSVSARLPRQHVSPRSRLLRTLAGSSLRHRGGSSRGSSCLSSRVHSSSPTTDSTHSSSPSSNSSSSSKHPSSSLGSSSSPSSSSSSSPSSSSRGSHPGGQTTLIPEDVNQLPSSSSSLNSSSSSNSSNSSSSQAHRRQLTFSKLRLRSRRQSGCRAVWQTQELLDVNSRHPPLVKSK